MIEVTLDLVRFFLKYKLYVSSVRTFKLNYIISRTPSAGGQRPLRLFPFFNPRRDVTASFPRISAGV